MDGGHHLTCKVFLSYFTVYYTCVLIDIINFKDCYNLQLKLCNKQILFECLLYLSTQEEFEELCFIVHSKNMTYNHLFMLHHEVSVGCQSFFSNL